MARNTRAKIGAPKGRILTPKELEFADGLHKAMTNKAIAEATLIVSRREIGQLTQDINKLGFSRATTVWAEAREKLGAPPAPTQEQLVRGT